MSKISELSDGGSLVSSDYLIAVRSGGNVKVRMDQINVDQVDLGDNEFIRLGNSQDLTMVHTSTQSIINQAGIGDLLIQRAGATKLTINASGIDVTGSVTADGLTVDGDTVTANAQNAVTMEFNSATGIISADRTGGNYADLSLRTTAGSTPLERLRISYDGDISFYEDTGTTPKLFWDASAESLGIGVSASLQGKLNVGGDLGGDPSMYVFGSRGAADNLPAGHLTFRNVANGVGDVNLSRIQSLTGTGSNQTQKGQLAFSTNDGSSLVERLRIDASGNIQQATSVNGDLYHHIFNANTGTSAEATLYISNGSTSSGLFAGATGTAFTTTGGFVQDGAHIGAAGGAAGGLSIMTRSNAPIRFYTNGHTNERARLDESGNLLVGKTVSGTANLGAELRNGSSNHAVIATATSEAPLAVNRKNNDGSLVNLYKDSASVGSIGSRLGSGITIDSGGTTDGVLKNNGAESFGWNSGYFYPRTDNSKDLGLSVLRWKDLYLSGGVVFGATGGAVTSKTLDDYETGTFTPTLFGSGSSATTLLTALGRYVKVGKSVTCWIEISCNGSTTLPTGNYISLAGLPFNPVSSRAFTAVVSVTGLTGLAAGTYFVGITNSGTSVNLNKYNQDGIIGTVGLTAASLTSTFAASTSITYEVA